MITMIKHIFFVFFFTSAFGLQAESSIQKKNIVTKSPNGVMHLAITIDNRHEGQSNNSTTVSQVTKQPNSPNESQFMNKVSELWQENLKIQKQLQEQGSQFLSTHKWYLLAAGLACSYGYLVYLIMSGSNYFADTSLWSSWHQELALDQLLAIPQQQITEELIREIQRRYTDSSSIADIVKPLGIFMVKIDQEEEKIKWYQSVYSWLSFLRLNKLVPISQIRFTKIPERLQRVAYYKNIFKSWAADYQLQQAERMWYRCPENESPDIKFAAQLLQIETATKTLFYWEKLEENRTPRDK